MNDNLIKTARSRAHKVMQDDKVLARARKFNSRESTPKKAVAAYARKDAVLCKYIVYVHPPRGLINRELPIHAINLKAAQVTGRELAAALEYGYIATKLAC